MCHDGKLVPVSSGDPGISPPSGRDAAHGPAAAGGHELRVRVHVLPPLCRVGPAQYAAENGIDAICVVYSIPNFITDRNLVFLAQ